MALSTKLWMIPLFKCTMAKNAVGAAAVVGGGYLIYLGAKWLAATLLAPFTSGGSYIVAVATP